jgi:predicted transcriptional regulator
MNPEASGISATLVFFFSFFLLTLTDKLSTLGADKLSVRMIAMPRTPKDVPAAELAVLQALWDHRRPVTVRQLTEVLYAAPADAAQGQRLKSEYASVLKLLERLEARGYVRRDRSQPVQVFEAAIDREDLVGHWLDTLAETLYGGSLSPLLTHLVSSGRLTVEERQSLRTMLDELVKKSGAKTDRRR